MLRVASWALYDFANTIFAINIVSFHFALWVTEDMRGEDIFYGAFFSASVFLAALLMPSLGSLSDRRCRKKDFLIVFTLFAVLFTVLMGYANRLLEGLLFFAAANFFVQLAAVFYGALLPSVSKRHNLGKTSGLGVGFGYFGAIIGMSMVKPFVEQYGLGGAFIPTAVLFFIFALPCMLFVREEKAFAIVKVATRPSFFRYITTTFNDIRDEPNLKKFLLSAYIYLNAVSAILVFVSVYARKVLGLTYLEIYNFFLASQIFAILSAFSYGFIADKFGAKRTLSSVLIIWSFVLLLSLLSIDKSSFWIIGPLAGIAVASTWTIGRVLLVKLVPKEKIGIAFGMGGLVGSFASITGPLIWGTIVWALGPFGVLRYRVAIFALLLFIIIGYAILQKVKVEE
ncbi:MAG: hypothetical protein AMJ78_09225 [Omnitrophica WOR_2 bacterium SM23_29]|nr:MAG: hypothetical protein AMJ78_09225 [Omnitrophica WOR_2 bacterium SM23_29]